MMKNTRCFLWFALVPGLILSVLGSEGAGHKKTVPAVLPLVLSEELSVGLLDSKSRETALLVVYVATPGGEPLFEEPAERVWWMAGRATLFLGATGYAFPDQVASRTIAYVHLYHEGVELPYSPLAIFPHRQMVVLEGDTVKLGATLARAIGQLDAAYLSAVANFLAENLMTLDVEATGYSITGFGTVIDASANWTGNPVPTDTPQQILTKLSGVDGPSSGLDADLLDGREGSEFVDTSTNQTIDGGKTFANLIIAEDDLNVGTISNSATVRIYNNGVALELLKTDGSSYGRIQTNTNKDMIFNNQASGGIIRSGDDLKLRFSDTSNWRDLMVGTVEVNEELDFYQNDVRVAQLNSYNDGIQLNIGDLLIDGNLTVAGAKHFVQPHPSDPAKKIYYVSLEGGEAGTYCRGTGHLEKGRVVIQLPEHFSLVTSAKAGLTAHITPLAECKGLFVTRVSNQELEVRELGSGRSNAAFSYLVNGVRQGYEDYHVIRDAGEK